MPSKKKGLNHLKMENHKIPTNPDFILQTQAGIISKSICKEGQE